MASGAVQRASLCFGLGGVAALLLWWGPSSTRRCWLVVQQLGMGAFVLTALVPMVELGDRLRQLPVRRMAALVLEHRRPQEPLAMVGILKPSLHYYTQQVVVYEGVQPNGPLNLTDRLAKEARRGQVPTPATPGSSVCLLYTSPSPRDRQKSRMPSSA